MEKLAGEPNAFIRPSPSGGTLGGVARRTREARMLCDAAGFDVVITETVGVGQSEFVLRSMVDFFLLILVAGTGDDLQGIKRGIMEMADLILVNKADGELLPTARRTCADYSGALQLLRRRPQDPTGFPKALMVSAAEGSGMTEVWAEITALAGWRHETGHHDRRRAEQARHWFEEEVRQGLLSALSREPQKGLMASLGDRVAGGDLSPEAAAAEMLRLLGRPA